MNISLETELHDTWYLWNHKIKNNWSMSGFEKVFEIKTIKDFWDLNNSWETNGGVHQNEYILMKSHIKPIWEDKLNNSGARWSFKVKDSNSQSLWDDLALYLVSGNLSEDYDLINGISISKKKKGNIVIKIWNSDINKSSLKLINYDILKKWGLDIIYIVHGN